MGGAAYLQAVSIPESWTWLSDPDQVASGALLNSASPAVILAMNEGSEDQALPLKITGELHACEIETFSPLVVQNGVCLGFWQEASQVYLTLAVGPNPTEEIFLVGEGKAFIETQPQIWDIEFSVSMEGDIAVMADGQVQFEGTLGYMPTETYAEIWSSAGTQFVLWSVAAVAPPEPEIVEDTGVGSEAQSDGAATTEDPTSATSSEIAERSMFTPPELTPELLARMQASLPEGVEVPAVAQGGVVLSKPANYDLKRLALRVRAGQLRSVQLPTEELTQ